MTSPVVEALVAELGLTKTATPSTVTSEAETGRQPFKRPRPPRPQRKMSYQHVPTMPHLLAKLEKPTFVTVRVSGVERRVPSTVPPYVEVYVQVQEFKGYHTVQFHGWYLLGDDDTTKHMWEKPFAWLPTDDVAKACRNRHGRLVIAKVHQSTVIDIMTGRKKTKWRENNLPSLVAPSDESDQSSPSGSLQEISSSCESTMPKEFRKRGKRSKKQREDADDAYIVYSQPEDKARRNAALEGKEYVEAQEQAAHEPQARRPNAPPQRDVGTVGSGIQGQATLADGQEEIAWPALDPDSKAYFRQLEEKILELEQLGIGHSQDQAQYGQEDAFEQDEDDRILLLRAALTELQDKETALATDPEASMILERLLCSMDDFARRVLADRFIGQYKDLSKNRFASHVIQTLLVLGGGETVERERRGNIAQGPAYASGAGADITSTNELPTMTETMLALTEELLEDIPGLVASQHGSYILRMLLVVLSGKPLPFDSHSASPYVNGALGRSKKSAKWKRNHVGQMKSFIPGSNSNDVKGKSTENRIVPLPFAEALQRLVEAIDDALCEGHPRSSREAGQSCRLKSDDPVATGLVQILLELDYDAGQSEVENSMMDRLLEGLPTALNREPAMQQPARSDYIETLLRSSVSSHVLEKIITFASPRLFNMLYKIYFQGRSHRLAAHPVANFVCIRVVERADREQTESFVDEIGEALPGCIENSRTGVIKALLDKCRAYSTRQSEMSKALCNAFQIKNEADNQFLLPCGLALMTLGLYRRNPGFQDVNLNPEHHLQGALLLQAWLRIPGSPVVKSIIQTPIDRLFSFTRDPVASRVIDVFLEEENTAVPLKDRRAFLKNLIGHYHILADDRIGSRVADRCWHVADPFLKDKIATSLLKHEKHLESSHFGHYFLRKVNLPLFRRDPYGWRDKQAQNVGATPAELRAQAAKKQMEHQQQRQAIVENVASSSAGIVKQEDLGTTPVELEKDATEPRRGSDGDEQADKKQRKKDKKRKKGARADEIDELFSSAKRIKAETSRETVHAGASASSVPKISKSAQVDTAIIQALKAGAR